MRTTNDLEREGIHNFLERFNFGSDGVIRRFSISFRASGRSTQAEIVLSVRDQETVEDGGWVNLVLELMDVPEFSCHEGSRGSFQVLSGGLHIVVFDEIFYVDFGYFWDDPSSLEEFRKSEFYFATASLIWYVKPYQEYESGDWSSRGSPKSANDRDNI